MQREINPPRHTRRGGIAALAAGALLLLAAPGAIAGSATVENATLNPPAPDWYACAASGPNTICRGIIPTDPVVDEPTGESCDGRPLYVTVVENVRVATRFYDADGDLAWRRVHATETDAFSLSASGAGPVVSVVGHWGWTVRYPVPGDESTGTLASHGLEARVVAPDGHVLLHQAGTLYSAGADFVTTGWHGPHPIEEDFGNLVAAICTGLGS
jgi:hypothetical protein